MAKLEWGTKRMCPGCGIRFYDMKRSPVKCPACETAVPTEVAVKSRKSAPAKAVAAKVEKPKPAETLDVEKSPDEITVEDVEIELDDDDDDDDDNLIEDASDLAEDDEVSEVAEHRESDGDTDT